MQHFGNPDPLTPREHAWLKHCAREFSGTVPEVRIDRSTPDIAYGGGTILLGKKFLAHRPDTFIRRQKLCHELVAHHIMGMVHGPEARAMGLYSDPSRDRFIRQLTKRLEVTFHG